MKVSGAAWEEIRSNVLGAARAGIETQRVIADELDRRARKASGKRREKLVRIAAAARETATRQEGEIAAIAT
jgi:hypothetical protein